jgi:hypothetical protein
VRRRLFAHFDNVVSRYGVPKGISLQSDNGKFVAKVASMFCKTFGIKRFSIHPQHPRSNSRCEQFGRFVKQSVKNLTTEQKNWSSHIQAIAMSHRGSSTTNLQLSPFEVLYGRPMIMFCDWGLLTDTYDSPSLTAYYRKRLHLN